MFVMIVLVLVLERFVGVGVRMRFGDVQPYAKRHQRTGN